MIQLGFTLFQLNSSAMTSFAVLVIIFALKSATGSRWEEETAWVGLEEDVPLPCSCKSDHRLLDLGHDYFPRYLPTLVCSLSTCWRGPYQCRERTYEVKVLTRRSETDEEILRHDFLLPESLRTIWKFELVPVTVACECTQ